MRLFTKFFALCALALCSTLCFALFLASQHYYRLVLLPDWAVGPHDTVQVDQRLVVFGDSWSDNNAASIQGLVWTDQLCSQFSCEQVNLAQTAKSARGNYIGSVVDNAELSSIRALFGLYRAPLADFKHQTRQWLDAESSDLRDLDEDAIRQRRKNTILVVSFGVWDIWNLVGTSYEKAAASADRSIEVLIEQLDLLSEGWDPNDFKVILTLPPDVTFFPAFKSTAKNHLDQLKDTVKIVQHWNDRLRDAVERWHLGTIHLFDTNAFLTDVIRDRQLFAEGVEEEEAGLWENVNDPCVTTRSQWAVVTDEQQCENPEKYLFWNEMHLGSSAHRLMGTEVFHQIQPKWLDAR